MGEVEYLNLRDQDERRKKIFKTVTGPEIDLKNERIYDLKYELDQAKDKLSNCEFEMKKRNEVSDAQFQKNLADTFNTERTDN
jgi:acyl-homoserine lactone acylase PvdQ